MLVLLCNRKCKGWWSRAHVDRNWGPLTFSSAVFNLWLSFSCLWTLKERYLLHLLHFIHFPGMTKPKGMPGWVSPLLKSLPESFIQWLPLYVCMNNGQRLVTWPPLTRIKARETERITKYKIMPLYKIRPLNTNGRENEYWVCNQQSATLIRKQIVLEYGNVT